MSKTTHTPGPWEAGVHPANNKLNLVRPVLFRANVTVLPECEGGHVALRSAADASLIAAAPDLLAALEELSDIVQGLLDDTSLHGLGIDSFTLQPAQAAIAKATGAK